MKTISMPKYLNEVFGKTQTKLEVTLTLLFSTLGTLILYFKFYTPIEKINPWLELLAFILIADVLAGCIANFTKGTNNFYAQKPKSRLIFISIHIHILVVAWLLDVPLKLALIAWAYTIVSAFIVNALKYSGFQLFIGANLVCYGIFLLISLNAPTWFLLLSIFFMIKVMFSFAVDHYGVKDIG